MNECIKRLVISHHNFLGRQPKRMKRDRLERIGGSPTSFLAKIALGVRAIETQTGALAPQVIQLNDGLSTIDGGLKVIDSHLVAAFTAVGKQGAGNA